MASPQEHFDARETMTASQRVDVINRLIEFDEAGDLYAHKELLRAIRGLQLAIEDPFETLFRLNFQSLENIAIRIATEKRWLHAIAATQGKPITATEIAVETESNAAITARILRLLASIGLCDEVGCQTYVSNHRTEFYTSPGTMAGVKFQHDITFPMGGRLADYMRSHELQLNPDSPEGVTLFQFTYSKYNLFELIETDDERKKLFDDYMAWRDRGQQCGWFDIYPVAEWLLHTHCHPEQALVVDIGGGNGRTLKRFLNRYPDHPRRLILQDLPSTLRNIDRLPEGIEVMEHDFFTPQPIRGASIYLLSRVLHDWSDVKCERILSNIVPVMDPDRSTLLIVDRVMPDQGADLEEAAFDVLMWMNYSGMERSHSQWTGLLEKVGLKLVQIWRSPGAAECALEVKRCKT